jgi:hypothetical protein
MKRMMLRTFGLALMVGLVTLSTPGLPSAAQPLVAEPPPGLSATEQICYLHGTLMQLVATLRDGGWSQLAVASKLRAIPGPEDLKALSESFVTVAYSHPTATPTTLRNDVEAVCLATAKAQGVRQ